MTHAARITPSIAHHGEGPYWDAARQRLLMVDMLAGDVLTIEDDVATRRHLGDVAAVIRGRSGGGYVVALEREIALTDAEWNVQSRIPVLASRAIRLNEGGCDPAGRFYCGSMAYDFATGAGTLFRLDPDLTLTTAVSGVTISNGIQWSADGRTAYYNDTASGRVDAFDVEDDGRLVGRRVFAAVETPGAPDGMAIDAEGGLWIALWGGSRVIRLDENGVLSAVVELPVPQVTSCTFGGSTGDLLYITTSREGMPAEDSVSGSVFAVEPGVRGGPVHPFNG